MTSIRPHRRHPAFALAAILLVSCSGAVEESQAEPPGEGWAFSYPGHKGGSRPAIDLRSLNEPVAGSSGFVKLTPDGNAFVLGDGSPARFWAIGSMVFEHSPAEVPRHVRFLAGMGVNMVRLHVQLAPKGPGSRIADVDEKEIDAIWRFVAEAKKQGIYTTISPYWALGQDAARWGIEGVKAPGDLWGLLFFDEALQAGYKGWARALYARVNPHTGIPLARDPSVALIQVQNEDSLFFWTAGQINPAQRAKLGRKFAGWLVARYGSADSAVKAWGSAVTRDDDFAGGRVALLGVEPMTRRPAGDLGRRVADEVAFIAETQRRFFGDIAAFYRGELGCGQLINDGNWKTANQTLLDDAERWSCMAGDVIATNRYYNGGSHLGDNSSWRIEPGHRFTQRSALLDPRSLPTNLKQVVGRPMIVTEGSWVAPLSFQAEGPFLVAVYQSLCGIDGFYWFAAAKPEYDLDPFFPYAKVEGQRPLMKFSASIPPILGSFPASALLFRKGYVRQGEPAVHEERALRSIWDRDPPMIAEDPSFDPLRDRGMPGPSGTPAVAGVDPLAFLVGPVEVKYEGDPAKSRVVDLSRYIDRDKKVVRSITGEVVLDYGAGLCTVDAPKAQGACGFLDRAGVIKLREVSIRSANPYATVLVVPLDDLPLATSKRVLVQVATASRPTGWTTRPAEFAGEDGKPARGLQVVTTGTPPWRVADAQVGLSIKNPGLTKASLLDPAGYHVEQIQVTKARTGLTLTLPAETMYLLLE